MAIEIIKAIHRKTGAVFFAPFNTCDNRTPGVRGMGFTQRLCYDVYDTRQHCLPRVRNYVKENGITADPKEWEFKVVDSGLSHTTYRKRVLELQLLEMIAGTFVLEHEFRKE